MRPKFYDYDYEGYVAKPLDYKDSNKPVEICHKCQGCGNNLGAQNHGYYCSTCSWINRSYSLYSR